MVTRASRKERNKPPADSDRIAALERDVEQMKALLQALCSGLQKQHTGPSPVARSEAGGQPSDAAEELNNGKEEGLDSTPKTPECDRTVEPAEA